MPLLSPDLIVQAKAIPVNEVAAMLGLVGQREGRSIIWKEPQKPSRFAINVTGELFYDHIAQRGGSGAISLVQHVRNCKFHDAVTWLTFQQCELALQQPDHSPIPKVQTEETPPLSYEEMVQKHAARHDFVWPIACDYLILERKLPTELVARLYNEGKIYATDYQHIDKNGNPTFRRPAVVFAGQSLDGTQHSLFLRDTKHQSPWRMFIGKKSLAPFTIGDWSSVEKIVAVESPIDALSYYCLQDQYRDRVFIASMGGNAVSQSLIDLSLTTGKPLVCALDNDLAGNIGWRSLQIKTLFHFAQSSHQPIKAESNPDGPWQITLSLQKNGTNGLSEDEVRKLLRDADQRSIPVTIDLTVLPHNLSREKSTNKDWNLDLIQELSIGQRALDEFRYNSLHAAKTRPPSQQLER